MPTVEKPIFKRTLEDVKFQMAQQDTITDEDPDKEVANMLNLSGNTDLIKGVYEGGFKTWECSVDMVQYLSTLPEDEITNKRVLEVDAHICTKLQLLILSFYSLVADLPFHHFIYYNTAIQIKLMFKITTSK